MKEIKEFLERSTIAKNNGTILEATYKIDEQKNAQFIGVEPLEPIDFAVLQGLAKLLKKRNITLGVPPGETLHDGIAFLLDTDFPKCFRLSIEAYLTADELLAEMELKNNNLDVWQSITRIACLSLFLKRGRGLTQLRLINSSCIDKSTGELFVAVNPCALALFLDN